MPSYHGEGIPRVLEISLIFVNVVSDKTAIVLEILSNQIN